MQRFRVVEGFSWPIAAWTSLTGTPRDPAPMFDASVSLGIVPALCVLVGDPLSDIEGARTAGARVIGYANKPANKAAFQAAGADAAATSMRQIAQALMQVEGL